jgi:peptidoglycan pentaglycine glycine transferase (the first glycine)
MAKQLETPSPRRGGARGGVMETVSIDGSRRQQWNDFVVATPDFSLLQSYEWGELKEKTGWKAVRLAVERQGKIVAAAQVLLRPAVRGLVSMAYIPRGPLVNWEDREAVTALCEAIHQEARRYRAIFLRIEPPLLHSPSAHSLLRSYGFQHVSHTNQPRCSMVVDLPEDMDELLMAFPPNTRNNIRRSERKGVTIDIADESHLPTLYHLMRVTGERSDFPIRTPDYYEQEWRTFSQLGQVRLFIARYEDKIIAAQMPFCFGEHAATFHAGSLNGYGNLKAGYLMMWKAMCWAREQGCRTFDLWGIPDEVGELIARGESIPEGKREGLWGVYYYKRAFRGRVVYYVGAYDYVYASLPYRTVEFATSRLGSVDRLAQVGDRVG